MHSLAPTGADLCKAAAFTVPYLLLHVEEIAAAACHSGRQYHFWRSMAQLPAATTFQEDTDLRESLMETYALRLVSLQANLDNMSSGFESIRKLTAAEEYVENKGWIMSAAVATRALHIGALLINPSLNTIELALGKLPALVACYIEMHEYLGASSLAITTMYKFNGVDAASGATSSALALLGVLLAPDDALQDPQKCTGFALIEGLESLLRLMCAFPRWTQIEDDIVKRKATFPVHSTGYAIMSLVDQLCNVFNPQRSFTRSLDFPWERFRAVVQHSAKMLLLFAS